MMETIVTVLFAVFIAAFLVSVFTVFHFETKRLDSCHQSWGYRRILEYKVDAASSAMIMSLFAVFIVGMIRVFVWGPWT